MYLARIVLILITGSLFSLCSTRKTDGRGVVHTTSSMCARGLLCVTSARCRVYQLNCAGFIQSLLPVRSAGTTIVCIYKLYVDGTAQFNGKVLSIYEHAEHPVIDVNTTAVAIGQR